MRHTRHALGCALLTAFCAQGAWASGYHFGTQSASAQGTANAGALEASDASVLFYNPAAMTLLDGTRASGVLNVVLPKGRYEDQGSFTSLNQPIQGGNGGRFVSATAVPHGYFTHKWSPDITVGVGVFVPFGSKSEYDADWVGRYNTIGTELKTIAINPSLSFKLNEKFSAGVGFTLQHIEGKLPKGADFGSGALNLIINQQVAANARPGVPTEVVRAAVVNQLSGLIKQVSGNPLYSGRVDVEGKDWGVGFNLGLMYQYDKDTRFGLAYRSNVRHKLKGDAHWQVQTPAANLAALLNGALGNGVGTTVQQRLVGLYTDSDASLNVNTPESLSLNFYKQQGKLGIMGDVTYTRHSRFQELRIDFANNLADSNTPQRWVNTTRASFGLNYQWSDALKLRGGVAFDQSPIDAISNRTPSIPDNDRTWLSAGLNWKLSPKSSLDFALSYIHVNASQINYYDNGAVTNASGSAVCDPSKNTSSCATIRGRYNLHSALLGIQYNHEF